MQTLISIFKTEIFVILNITINVSKVLSIYIGSWIAFTNYFVNLKFPLSWCSLYQHFTTLRLKENPQAKFGSQHFCWDPLQGQKDWLYWKPIWNIIIISKFSHAGWEAKQFFSISNFLNIKSKASALLTPKPMRQVSEPVQSSSHPQNKFL